MSRRPLVTVPALTLADLLLWHWSLTAPHAVLAIVAGLTLPPLVVASMWLLAIACVRLLARGVRPLTRVSRTRAVRASARGTAENDAIGSSARTAAVPSPTKFPTTGPTAARPTAPRPAQVPLASADRKRPPGKLAA